MLQRGLCERETRMSDIFNLNNDQPQIQNGMGDSKCPVCGHHISEQTKVCPNCHETIWQDPDTADREIDDSGESDIEELSPKEKEIQKYISTYNQILMAIAIVIAIPLAWITYKEFSDNQWNKAVWFVLVIYFIVCRFIGYLLKGIIRSIAERKIRNKV